MKEIDLEVFLRLVDNFNYWGLAINTINYKPINSIVNLSADKQKELEILHKEFVESNNKLFNFIQELKNESSNS